jgi:hypothetical protein
MSVYIQLLSGDTYEIEVFESCCILNVRRMLGIQLRKNGWGNHFNDDLIRFYSDDCQSIDDDHFVEENEHYHVVIREDKREDPEVLLCYENNAIVFCEFHTRDLLASTTPEIDIDNFLQSDSRVSWFSPSYRAHLSIYRTFLVDGINFIRDELIYHFGTTTFNRILSGHSISEDNDDDDEDEDKNKITFIPGSNVDHNIIRLYIQTFFPFQIVGNIIILE